MTDVKSEPIIYRAKNNHDSWNSVFLIKHIGSEERWF